MARWLLRGAAALAGLAVLAVVALLLIPTERLAQVAADRLSAATGRAVTVAGPVRATLWPRLGLRAEGIAVANADWSADGPLLEAAAVELELPFATLFGGDLRIDAVVVEGARLRLERREDGRGNWERAASAVGAPTTPAAPTTSAAPDADGTPRETVVARAVLRDAAVSWLDRSTDRRFEASGVAAETRLDGLDAPFAIEASGMLAGFPVTLRASAPALRPLLDGVASPFALELTAGGTTLALDGRGALNPPTFEGRAEIASEDGLAALAALGIAPPDLPRGPGARRLAASAQATLTPAGTAHLRGMAAELDGLRIAGDVDLDPAGARPRIVATLRAEALDLSSGEGGNEAADASVAGGEGAATGGGGPADAGAGGTATPPPASGGWSTAPIDLSGLFAADAEIALSTGPIEADGFRVDALEARATVEDGRAAIALAPLQAFGGTVTGEVVANGRGGVSMRADLAARGVALRPLLHAFGGTDRLEARADLDVSLLGAGGSVAALMSGLGGSVALRLGPGRVTGIDLPGLVRELAPGLVSEDGAAAFDGLGVSASIADGIARSDDLALTGPYLTAGGAGSADLGARTVSYRLMPTLSATPGGGGITVPVDVEGPWDDPAVTPDLEWLARERLGIDREAVEARLREEAGDALRQRLADELEVAPEALDGRDALEDAIRSRVEDRLLDFLGR